MSNKISLLISGETGGRFPELVWFSGVGFSVERRSDESISGGTIDRSAGGLDAFSRSKSSSIELSERDLGRLLEFRSREEFLEFSPEASEPEPSSPGFRVLSLSTTVTVFGVLLDEDEEVMFLELVLLLLFFLVILT